HTLRQLIENDQQWRQILIGLNSEFRHKTVTTDQIEHYISKATGIDLTEFWEQYLRRANIPVFDYLIDQNTLKYRYLDVVDGFDMPLKVNINDETLWLYPNKTWQSLTAAQPLKTFAIDPNFLVTTRIETQD
ncbi:MAG TPA: peptidase M1, partial [Flavobacteriaceae bacterium]|nr:peptidase M1 [Flavobacteriaceae bacterium]